MFFIHTQKNSYACKTVLEVALTMKKHNLVMIDGDAVNAGTKHISIMCKKSSK